LKIAEIRLSKSLIIKKIFAFRPVFEFLHSF